MFRRQSEAEINLQREINAIDQKLIIAERNVFFIRRNLKRFERELDLAASVEVRRLEREMEEKVKNG